MDLIQTFVMRNTIVLHILIPIWLTLTLVQGHGVRESKNFCANYLSKFLIDLNWIWYTIETCWCDEPHIHSMLSIEHSSETYLYYKLYDVIKKRNFNVGLYSEISFILGMVIKSTKLYILVSVWMTLTFIQGHSCIRNKKILVSIFS